MLNVIKIMVYAVTQENSITWLRKPLLKTVLWPEMHVCVYVAILSFIL